MAGSQREVAIAVPSLNQGEFIDAALQSLWDQTEVLIHGAVLDAGSVDQTPAILNQHGDRLVFSRIGPDAGQAAAVNEGIAQLVERCPHVTYVGWLNADDIVLTNGISTLVRSLEANPAWVAVAGRAYVISQSGEVVQEVPTAPFSAAVFARACTISQPATLVRRQAWAQVGGLDVTLQMCFDYDLWWRLAKLGPIGYVDVVVAATRDHPDTKTRTRRQAYFREGAAVVRRHTGYVPWHWCVSEALEREAGWRIGADRGWRERMRAGPRAVMSYLHWNCLDRSTS